MKIRTSYFYQVRNFKPYMIPVSTALGDPKWYHDFGNNYVLFKDKRNILNGIRFLYIMAQKNCGGCPCNEKNPAECEFLRRYKEELNKLDFEQIMQSLTWLAESYQQMEDFKEEPIVVLLVHESYKNPCSERNTLINYFNEHGVECSELKYPIGDNYE